MDIHLYVIDDSHLQMAVEHANQCRRLTECGQDVNIVKHGKTENEMNIISLHYPSAIDANTFSSFSEHSYRILYDDRGFVEIKSIKHRTLANADVISNVLNIANELYIKEMKKG